VDIATVLGLIAGFGLIFAGFILEGGNPLGLIQVTAALIVFGGTLGAMLVSFPMSQLMKLPKGLMKAFFVKPHDPSEMIALFTRLAEKARREGLLSLEEEEGSLDDDFIKKGVALVVDGTDPELITAILEIEISAMEKRHGEVQGMLEAAGGYSPTMGIIGTVMGLVTVLSHIDEPEKLGGGVAVAFVATLYGVMAANLVYLPLAGKLKGHTHEEVMLRRMMLEGILSVQAGENPRVVQEKLLGFLPPAQRAKVAGEATRHGEEAEAA
jgi:chemotaxis protein MotA